jgi:hypothetical protein
MTIKHQNRSTSDPDQCCTSKLISNGTVLQRLLANVCRTLHRLYND